MKIAVSIVAAAVCIGLALLGDIPAQGQPGSVGFPVQPGGPKKQIVGVGFRNDSNVPLLVQGYTIVNNVQRRGQPIVVAPNKLAWENNVPTGVRFYTVSDATQPSKSFLRDFPVQVGNQDMAFQLKQPNPTKVVLVPVPLP